MAALPRFSGRECVVTRRPQLQRRPDHERQAVLRRHRRGRPSQHVLVSKYLRAPHRDGSDRSRPGEVSGRRPQAVDHRVELAAAGVRLEADVVDGKPLGLLQEQLGARLAAVQLEESVLAVERALRRLDPGLRQLHREHALLGSVARMRALDSGAGRLVGELHRAARHRQRVPPGAAQPGAVEAPELGRRRCRAEPAEQRGRVMPELDDMAGIGRRADPRHRLVAGNDRCHEVLARAVALGRDRQRRRNDNRCGVAHGGVVRVVELVAVGRRAVDQRRNGRRHTQAGSDHGSLSHAGVRRGPAGECLDRRLPGAPVGAAGDVEQQARDLLVVFSIERRWRNREDARGEVGGDVGHEFHPSEFVFIVGLGSHQSTAARRARPRSKVGRRWFAASTPPDQSRPRPIIPRARARRRRRSGKTADVPGGCCSSARRG